MPLLPADVAERSRLELPSGAATLLIAFAEPLRTGLAPDGESRVFQRSSFLSAGRTLAAISRHRGHIHGVELTLSHTGAHRGLGLRMAGLGHDVSDPPRLWLDGSNRSASQCVEYE